MQEGQPPDSKEDPDNLSVFDVDIPDDVVEAAAAMPIGGAVSAALNGGTQKWSNCCLS